MIKLKNPTDAAGDENQYANSNRPEPIGNSRFNQSERGFAAFAETVWLRRKLWSSNPEFDFPGCYIASMRLKQITGGATHRTISNLVEHLNLGG